MQEPGAAPFWERSPPPAAVMVRIFDRSGLILRQLDQFSARWDQFGINNQAWDQFDPKSVIDPADGVRGAGNGWVNPKY
jgi:hypothetical protein